MGKVKNTLNAKNPDAAGVAIQPIWDSHEKSNLLCGRIYWIKLHRDTDAYSSPAMPINFLYFVVMMLLPRFT